MPETPGGGSQRESPRLEASGAAARRDAEHLLEPAAELLVSNDLDRRQVRSALPHVLLHLPVALLLVDQRSSAVVYANQAALDLAGDVALPLPLADWGRASSLTDLRGAPLTVADSVLSRVMRGTPGGGEAVRAAPRPSDPPDLGRVLWATGFPLTPTAEDGEAPLALLVFLEVGTPPGAADDPEALLAALRNRAVIATDLAFTISDPGAPDNPLIWVNPAFTRMTGYGADEAVGRNCRFLQGPQTDPVTVAEIRDAIAASEPITVVLLNYRADGTPFWNQLSISPVFDGDGALISFVGVQHDVSERITSDLEREQALLAERRAREETERARARLALLAEVTTQLSATLDTRESLERLADLLVPALADWVVIALRDEGPNRSRLVIRHRDGNASVVARYAELAPDAHLDNPLIDDLIGGGAPRLLEGLDREALAARAGPEIVEVVEALGYDSAIYVPLIARQRRVLGTMILVSTEPSRRFGFDDLSICADLGRRAGITLDNARLYEQEHRVAEVLQRSLLPAIPKVDGAAVSASYLPANSVADVGGDFYELLDLPDGSLGVAIGDVVGHDMTAAAAMGHLRGLLRACAWETADEGRTTEPGRVLDRVDRLVQGLDVVPLATLVYLRAERATDGAVARPDESAWRLSWASAGHPPPLVRLPDGAVEPLVGAGGVLLGATDDATRSSAVRTVPPGTTVVGYTDGLIERRGEDLDLGIARLCAALAQSDPTDLDGLVQALVGGIGETRDDDIAVIAVRLD
ncbi:MAG TPA: SpoIIE family protein phosphatase [Acidimicrobiales bacterium]|nr:SpoIIE family protein phosphatase [Acidimicrobiales bacterium]